IRPAPCTSVVLCAWAAFGEKAGRSSKPHSASAIATSISFIPRSCMFVSSCSHVHFSPRLLLRPARQFDSSLPVHAEAERRGGGGGGGGSDGSYSYSYSYSP